MPNLAKQAAARAILGPAAAALPGNVLEFLGGIFGGVAKGGAQTATRVAFSGSQRPAVNVPGLGSVETYRGQAERRMAAPGAEFNNSILNRVPFEAVVPAMNVPPSAARAAIPGPAGQFVGAGLAAFQGAMAPNRGSSVGNVLQSGSTPWTELARTLFGGVGEIAGFAQAASTMAGPNSALNKPLNQVVDERGMIRLPGHPQGLPSNADITKFKTKELVTSFRDNRIELGDATPNWRSGGEEKVLRELATREKFGPIEQPEQRLKFLGYLREKYPTEMRGFPTIPKDLPIAEVKGAPALGQQTPPEQMALYRYGERRAFTAAEQTKTVDQWTKQLVRELGVDEDVARAAAQQDVARAAKIHSGLVRNRGAFVSDGESAIANLQTGAQAGAGKIPQANRAAADFLNIQARYYESTDDVFRMNAFDKASRMLQTHGDDIAEIVHDSTSHDDAVANLVVEFRGRGVNKGIAEEMAYFIESGTSPRAQSMNLTTGTFNSRPQAHAFSDQGLLEAFTSRGKAAVTSAAGRLPVPSGKKAAIVGGTAAAILAALDAMDATAGRESSGQTTSKYALP